MIYGATVHSGDELTEATRKASDTEFVPNRPCRTHHSLWHRIALPVEPGASNLARDAMRSVCAAWSVPHLYESAAACVTELVTNAVQHARWPEDPKLRVVWLVTSVAGPYLVAEVSDPDQRLPVIGEPVDWDRFDWSATEAGDGLGESGFGLSSVVERVHEVGGEFGVIIAELGKTVFFALPIAGRISLPGLADPSSFSTRRSCLF